MKKELKCPICDKKVKVTQENCSPIFSVDDDSESQEFDGMGKCPNCYGRVIWKTVNGEFLVKEDDFYS